MLNKNIRLCLLSLMLFLLGCDADAAKSTDGTTQSNSISEAKQVEGEESVNVMIRIANRSTVKMNNIVIQFPNQTERYSRIVPGEVTEYRQVTEAYRYAPVEVSINGEVRRMIATDYVGEEQLSSGNYTYALTFDPNQSSLNGLGFQLERDK